MHEIPDEIVDQLLAGYEDAGDLTGPEGLINRLRKRLIERAAGAEVELPRDREASFEPRIVHKRFDVFDEQILALYAVG